MNLEFHFSACGCVIFTDFLAFYVRVRRRGVSANTANNGATSTDDDSLRLRPAGGGSAIRGGVKY